MNIIREVFPLAEGLTRLYIEDAQLIELGEPNDFINRVTPVTAALLKYWFQQDYCDTRTINFHRGQRDAILSVIYAHEVLGTTTLLDLYEKVAPEALLGGGVLSDVSSIRDSHPKYAAKMATGTGKTWVLNALLVWQLLNADENPADVRFTANFLVVAPGLIVYDRLLDSFLGKKADDGTRDFESSDAYAQRSLFVPENRREKVFGFLQSSVITKNEIGSRVTGSGMVAITNWHVLAGREGDEFVHEDDLSAPGVDIDARAAVRSFIPLSPGSATGNALDVLDRAYERGRALDWLSSLPSLFVFNDEAHHVHTLKRDEQQTEVEWQRSLNTIAANKGRRFTQVDFSATPYDESGPKKAKKYFAHIVTDFDIHQAMQAGLVKSLALDKRKEIAALANTDLDFRAERDERDRVIGLSEGQRVMLRAGLKKLAILEQQFAAQDPTKHPKLLIVTEDTNVSPYVEEFLLASGLSEADVLRVDSGRKTELGPKEWEPLRVSLFDVDRRQSPKVIVSVLMLREGFDVNSICVIVPLRSSQSGILLEQTIGRGLRLMWRGDPEIDALKNDNRERVKNRQEPTNSFDVLFVVEHPAFSDFYERELGDGLIWDAGDNSDKTPTGDLSRVELREGFEQFDFHIPFIIREAEDELRAPLINIDDLATSKFPLAPPSSDRHRRPIRFA